MTEPNPARRGSTGHDVFLDLCAAFVLGALSETERFDLEEHLASGCRRCTDTLHRLSETLADLAEVAPAIEPLRLLEDSILATIRSRSNEAVGGSDSGLQPWKRWERDDADGGAPPFLVRSLADDSWEETGVDGITVRPLFVDRANNRMTAVFRMAAGTSYVPHVHSGYEECYVLEGDLHVGDSLVMHAGDYQRAEAGSVHGAQRTVGGCLLLISSSLSDETFSDGPPPA